MSILILKRQWDYLGKNKTVISKMAEWCESGRMKKKRKLVQT